ncbi:hypothetical protein H4S07_000667 [Coemansia furcata]|uniref:Uncharacterized protein n=1 Tax=Coemansia furcata TaxID=417177 RepID=A0ACC1LPJ8_9FUNG|nr:hypothetical protein H4S07_000667 [Coemansia furcata]
MPITEDNTGPRPGIVMLRTDLFDSLGPEWREVALEHYFSNFILAFNNPFGKINSTRPLDDGFISVKKERHAITSVKIYVSLDDIISGKAAYMLAQSEYSSLVFPSVVRMTIDISDFHKSEWNFDTDSVTSPSSLYQQLMVMFPGVKKVKLLKGARGVEDIDTANCEFEQFLLDLFTKFRGASATFNLNGGMDSMWNVEDVHSAVTEMALFKDSYSEIMLELVHKCNEKIDGRANTGEYRVLKS